MTCEVYPIYKSCTFLAVNYYNEISNTFEDCLTEALIGENTFLEKENIINLGSLDKSYRSPWQKIQCDEKFLYDEATKAEESISDITINAFLNSYEPSWFCDNDDGFHDDKLLEIEENAFEEKDLEISNDNTLDGKFELLDVSYIPFNLSSVAAKRPLLNDLLGKLPMMEVEEAFEDDFNFEFEDLKTFFDTDFDECEKKLSQSSKENRFKEIILPELPIEDDFTDIININKNNGTMKDSMKCIEDNCENDTKLNGLSHQSKNSYPTINSDFDGDYKSNCSKDDQENSFVKLIQTEAEDETQMSDFEENFEPDSALNYESTKENTSVVPSKFNCFEMNVNSNTLQFNSTSFGHSNSDDSVLNIDFESFNPDFDINELISKVTASSQIDEGNNDYEAYSFSNNPPECDENFHNFGDGNSSSQNKNIVRNCLPEPQFEENEGFVEDLAVIDDNEKSLFISKISKLKLEKNISENKDNASSLILPNTEPRKNLKSCTAVRKECFSNSPLPSTSSKNTSEDEGLSQTSNSSKTVNLLHNFLNITKLSNNNLTNQSPSFKNSKSKSKFLQSNFKDKGTEDSKTTFVQESVVSEIQSFSKNKSSFSIVSELKVADLLVKLPDEMIEMAYIYEATATPLLISLLQSNKFKLPLKFTIADISPCKTCFLLNQEVKQSRDKNVSVFKESEKGKSYYTQLLAFHGLLKSFECFLHFDVQLAASNLLEFEERHLSVLKGCYDSFNKIHKSEMNNCIEINDIHPKLREMNKFIKEKLSWCKETGQIFKVMIIIKKYLNVLYEKFECALREEMCNIKSFLIPESVFLHENTLMFKSTEHTIYFVSPSSLSKNIPWQDLFLVIEFQHDSNSSWKHICSENNVSHAFIRVSDLPLKSLDEIQKLKIPDKTSINSVQEKVRSLIVSSSITSQYQLLYLLESKLKAFL